MIHNPWKIYNFLLWAHSLILYNHVLSPSSLKSLFRVYLVWKEGNWHRYTLSLLSEILNKLRLYSLYLSLSPFSEKFHYEITFLSLQFGFIILMIFLIGPAARLTLHLKSYPEGPFQNMSINLRFKNFRDNYI